LDNVHDTEAKAYGTYEELMQDPDVDIIYVATPHSLHFKNVHDCLEAGKHVLCEKPFTVNGQQAEILIQLAKKKRLFLMEAVWTRFFPQSRRIREMIQRGDIGTVYRVTADFSFTGYWTDEHRYLNPYQAGGCLLDSE
jgi:dihydrodiol dehydrogenase / D-xylose 1-dehydrogenase (NADP)